MTADEFGPATKTHGVTSLPLGEPILLDSKYGRRSIGLTFSHLYALESGPGIERGRGRAWSIRPLAYLYDVQDRDGSELFAYHWDPDESALGWAKFPHLHVSGRLPPLPLGSGSSAVSLGDLHFPTEPVAFAAIVRLLLVEFAVPARRPEAESRTILASSEMAFRQQHLRASG